MKRAVLAALLLAALCALARADVSVSVDYGHGRRNIGSAATPFAVTLENTGDSAVTVDLTVGRGGVIGGGASYHRSVVLGPAAVRRELFLLEGTGSVGDLGVDLRTSPRTPLHTRGRTADRGVMQLSVQDEFDVSERSISYETRILGIVGRKGAPLERLIDRIRGGDVGWGAQDGIAAVFVDPRELAVAPFALDGIDTLLVCDPDSAFAEDPETATAVLDWVALGGRLMVALGDDAASFGASPFARHMPARWTGASKSPLDRLLPFPLESDDVAAARSVTAVNLMRSERPEDEVVDRADGAPLYARRRVGYGSITLLPFDISSSAVVTVSDGEKDAARLTKFLLPLRVPSQNTLDQAQNYAVSFQNVQLGDSMSHIIQQNAFEPPPLPLVLLGLLAYVLLVGPVDWIILKRLRKERLTTLTFAALVTVFTVLAYGASFLLFSSGAVVNRVVLADLVDTGDGGRQVLRVIDMAGFYAPTGDDVEIEPEGAGVVFPGSLPTTSEAGDVGRSRELFIESHGPAREAGLLSIGFRSQRVVRITSLKETGRSIDVAWIEPGLPNRGVRVTNTLANDLEDAYVLLPNRWMLRVGPVAAGATVECTTPSTKSLPGSDFASNVSSVDKNPTRDSVLSLFTFLSHATQSSASKGNPFERLSAQELVILQKTGIDRSQALDSGSALLIAYSAEAPVPLPQDDRPGNRFVLIRKEIPIR